MIRNPYYEELRQKTKRNSREPDSGPVCDGELREPSSHLVPMVVVRASRHIYLLVIKQLDDPRVSGQR
jgi:hypothetical protein